MYEHHYLLPYLLADPARNLIGVPAYYRPFFNVLLCHTIFTTIIVGMYRHTARTSFF